MHYHVESTEAPWFIRSVFSQLHNFAHYINTKPEPLIPVVSRCVLNNTFVKSQQPRMHSISNRGTLQVTFINDAD
jgi:hypothetical protein